MLRVRVEIIPHGVDEGTQIVEEAYVWNDETGQSAGRFGGGTGNYGLSETDPRTTPYDGDHTEPERDLGSITGLIRIPRAHWVTMARTALERLEYKRYQENGLYPTDPPDGVLVRESAEDPASGPEASRDLGDAVTTDDDFDTPERLGQTAEKVAIRQADAAALQRSLPYG